MSDTKKEFYISRLIIKSVLETLSSEEAIDLEEWLNRPGNRSFYSRILKEENFQDKVDLFKKLNTEAAYSRLINRIEKQRKVTSQKPSIGLGSIYKYAAVALLFISVGYFSYFHVLSNAPAEITVSKVVDLKPGYNKATLVLEDGTEIDLEKNEFVKEQTLAKLKNEDNTLIYESNRKNENSKASEIVGTNTLFVPVGGIYKLVLPDGSTVWLNSSSSLKYPTSFEGDQRMVELSGEAYFDVVKDDSKAFIVKTKTRDISVLGTSFNVSAYNDDIFFAATLAEGKIKLTHENTKEVFLKPGEQAIVDYNSFNTSQVVKVDPEIYSTWKNGTFFFENESLENILRKVGRWYNFQTDFSEARLSKITFTGLASKEFPAKRLLDRISKSSNITYEIIQNNENEESIIKISKK
ncbi:MAG: FecR family protein [Gelidibacter sp.]